MKVEKQFIISRLVMAIVLWSKIGHSEAFGAFMLIGGKSVPPIEPPIKSGFSMEDEHDFDHHKHMEEHEMPIMLGGADKGPQLSDLWHMMPHHIKYDVDEHEVFMDHKDHYEPDNMNQHQMSMGKQMKGANQGKSGGHEQQQQQHYEDDSHHANWRAWKNVLSQRRKQGKELPKKQQTDFDWSQQHYEGGQQKVDCEPEPEPKPEPTTTPKPTTTTTTMKPTTTSTTTTTTTTTTTPRPTTTTTSTTTTTTTTPKPPVKGPVKTTTTEAPIFQQQIITQAPVIEQQIQQTTDAPPTKTQQQHDISDTKFSFNADDHDLDDQVPVSGPMMMPLVFEDRVYHQPEEKGRAGGDHGHKKGMGNQLMIKGDHYQQMLNHEISKQMIQQDDDNGDDNDGKQRHDEMKKGEEEHTKGMNYHDDQRQQQHDDDKFHQQQMNDGHQMAKGQQEMVADDEHWKDYGQQMNGAKGEQYNQSPGKSDQGPQKKIVVVVSQVKGDQHGGAQKGMTMQQMKDAYGPMMIIKGQPQHGHMAKGGLEKLSPARGNEIHGAPVKGQHPVKGGYMEVSIMPTKGGPHQQQQHQPIKGGLAHQMIGTYGMRLKEFDDGQQKKIVDTGYDQMSKGGATQHGKNGYEQQQMEKDYNHQHVKGQQQEEFPKKGAEFVIVKKGGKKQPIMLNMDHVQNNENKPIMDQGFMSNVVETSASQRARESFLNAAGIARHLTSTGKLNGTNSHHSSSPELRQIGASESNSMGSSSSLVGSDQTAPNLRRSPDRVGGSSSANGSNQFTTARYLGPGELQKYEGNNRTQARLGCQFASPNSANVSVWNVEWNRFEGDYNVEQQQPPPFECQDKSSCQMVPIKTDTLTTIHPRPFVQNYADGSTAPSYSVTLHEVDENHLGKYRCSAQRKVNGRTEVVYRIISLE